MLRVINMIPRSLSGETGQDSEPNLAVNPENPQQIVATAFTRDPLNGKRAPVFVSADGGLTWSLMLIVPSGGPQTLDISVAFGTRGGGLYAGILKFTDANLAVLRTANPFLPGSMTPLVDRPDEDQPWVTAATGPAAVGGADQDRVYIGHNNFNVAPRTASVESSQDARATVPPGGFSTSSVESGHPAGQDGPPVRTAVHADGTVYAAFQRWDKILKATASFTDVDARIVLVRDDNWGGGPHPFSTLVDPDDGSAGVTVASGRFVRFTASTGPLGQERIGADLAAAVDPTDSAKVWVAWGDRVGGAAGTDWTLHVRRSRDRGRTWSADVRTITNAKNPGLVVNEQGQLGMLFQQVVGVGAAARWVTQLEVTDDAWQTPATTMVLHTALAMDPPRHGLPYLGDYLRLLAVGNDFYGVFAGSNLADPANFPMGVTYQRNADWVSHTLLGADNVTPVGVSIDPFLVHYVP